MTWRPIDTAPECEMLLFRAPTLDRGLPGCEVLMIFHNREHPDIGRTYWTNGGPNGGCDFNFEKGEEPDGWQYLPPLQDPLGKGEKR